MVTTSDVQTFARALYEALMSTALKQLSTAAPKLAGVDDSDPNVRKRIESALPSETLPEVRNFLMVLAREGALDQLPEIVQAFESYAQASTKILEAEVTSALPLSQSQREHIVKELQRRYDKQIEVHFNVDESLIGGLIIRVGDQVLDNSLRVRLNAIQRNMLSS